MRIRSNLWVMAVFGGATAAAVTYLIGSLLWFSVTGEASLTGALPGAAVTMYYVWRTLVRAAP